MKIRVILHQQRCAVRDALHVHADLYALGLYSIDVVVQWRDAVISVCYCWVLERMTKADCIESANRYMHTCREAHAAVNYCL